MWRSGPAQKRQLGTSRLSDVWTGVCCVSITLDNNAANPVVLSRESARISAWPFFRPLFAPAGRPLRALVSQAMATSQISDIPAITFTPSANGSSAATATLPLPLPVSHEHEHAARPGDERGARLRRMLLGADVAALSAALAITQLTTRGISGNGLPLLVLSVPLWVLLAYAHRLYHLDSYRADYRASDELGPVLQMATVWSWLTAPRAPRWWGPTAVPIDRLALFWVLTVLLLTGLRSVARSFARRQPWYLQDALVGRAAGPDRRDRPEDRSPPRVGNPREGVRGPLSRGGQRDRHRSASSVICGWIA